MRTKEDIIVDLDVVSDGWDSTYPYSEVKKAMDEYAKEVVMEFLQWKWKSTYKEITVYPLLGIESSIKEITVMYENKQKDFPLTKEQLFDKFKQENNIQ